MKQKLQSYILSFEATEVFRYFIEMLLTMVSISYPNDNQTTEIYAWYRPIDRLDNYMYMDTVSLSQQDSYITVGLSQLDK